MGEAADEQKLEDMQVALRIMAHLIQDDFGDGPISEVARVYTSAPKEAIEGMKRLEQAGILPEHQADTKPYVR